MFTLLHFIKKNQNWRDPDEGLFVRRLYFRAKALPRITSPDTLSFAFATLLEAKVRRIELSSANIIWADTAILLVYSPI